MSPITFRGSARRAAGSKSSTARLAMKLSNAAREPISVAHTRTTWVVLVLHAVVQDSGCSGELKLLLCSSSTTPNLTEAGSQKPEARRQTLEAERWSRVEPIEIPHQCVLLWKREVFQGRNVNWPFQAARKARHAPSPAIAHSRGLSRLSCWCRCLCLCLANRHF
jgi:hypothetical protein